MIGFLQPLVLLALVAAAGPALLHLLQRREPPVVPFPAVQYLQEAARQHSRRLRLHNLLLLLLRTCIILLLVLAAARPVARLSTPGGHAPLAIAVVLDHSLSSGAIVGGVRVSDTLAARARGIFAAAGPDDHLWLVLADGIPRRVSRSEAGQLLDGIQPTAVRLDLGAAVRAAAQAVDGDILPGQILVLSDNQATAWSAGPVTVPVLVWEAPGPSSNHSIDSLRAEPPIWPGGGRLVVGLGGDGGAVAVRFDVDGTTHARALAGPGDVVELEAALPPGWHAGRVVLDGDELRADDERHVAIRVTPPARVTAGPGAGPFVGAAVAALREAGRFATSSGMPVAVDERLGPGVHVLLPPSDPALVGTVNRQLAARGIAWRFGAPGTSGDVISPVLPVEGATVTRRYRLDGGAGGVVARVDGAPWIVRAGDVVLMGSRLDPAWTSLPVTASFVPFLDLLINQVAAADAWMVEAVPGATVVLPAGDLRLVGAAGAVAVGADGAVTAPLELGVWYAVRGTDTVGALVVNPDPRESRLEPAAQRALRGALGPTADVTRRAAPTDVFAATAARADLTPVLLVLALAAVIAEFLVAARMGRPAGAD